MSSLAICPSCVGLVDHNSGSRIVKLTRVALYTKLHDLHMSEPFGPNIEADTTEPSLPDEWYDASLPRFVQEC